MRLVIQTKVRTSMGILKQPSVLKPNQNARDKIQGASSHDSRRKAEIVRDTILGAEIVDERIRRPRSCIFRHILQKFMNLSKILALIGRCTLDELFPGVGVGQTCRPETVEDLVLGFDGGDHRSVDRSTDELLHLRLC